MLLHRLIGVYFLHMERQSFIIYAALYNSMRDWPTARKRKVLHAICEYMIHGKDELEFKGFEEVIWNLTKSFLNNEDFKQPIETIEELTDYNNIELN